MSVRRSVFFKNSAGSVNVKDGEVSFEKRVAYIFVCRLFFVVGTDRESMFAIRPLGGLDRGRLT